MTVITIVQINARDLYAGDSPEEQRRYADVERLIEGLGGAIVAVQELKTPHQSVLFPRKKMVGEEKAEQAALRLARLGDSLGMAYQSGGQPFVAVGGGQHHTGLLWNPALVAPAPKPVGRYERDPAGTWHSIITAVFDLDLHHSPPPDPDTTHAWLRVASVHLSPFSQQWALQDADQLLRAMQVDDIPGLACGDYNGIGATKVRGADGRKRYYDLNPYKRVAWKPIFAHQYLNGRLNRSAAIHLERDGGMQDCARLTTSKWTPTSGHFAKLDQHPLRRPDRTYATANCPTDAIVAHRVADKDVVGVSTDHLPISTDVAVAPLRRFYPSAATRSPGLPG